MKFCKYCNNEMFGEFETNSKNSHRYKAFYNCQNCKAVCEGEYIKTNDCTKIITERWWNPNTKTFD